MRDPAVPMAWFYHVSRLSDSRNGTANIWSEYKPAKSTLRWRPRRS